MTTFEKKIEIRWADADANGHVRHSAYYDYGAHIRIRFFEKLGFKASEMNKLSIGPILFKEECSFIKELQIEDTITINLKKGAVSEDGSRWEIHHEIFNTQGEKSAHISMKGAWLDLNTRKLTIPPSALAEAFHNLELGNGYLYKKSK
jgi:acyl-CoA thioester hydrolase